MLFSFLGYVNIFKVHVFSVMWCLHTANTSHLNALNIRSIFYVHTLHIE